MSIGLPIIIETVICSSETGGQKEVFVSEGGGVPKRSTYFYFKLFSQFPVTMKRVR